MLYYQHAIHNLWSIIQFFFWILLTSVLFFYYYLSPFTSRCWVSHAVQCFITCEICLHPMMFFETVLHTKKAQDAHCGLWLPKCVSLSCFSRGFYFSLIVNFCAFVGIYLFLCSWSIGREWLPKCVSLLCFRISFFLSLLLPISALLEIAFTYLCIAWLKDNGFQQFFLRLLCVNFGNTSCLVFEGNTKL